MVRGASDDWRANLVDDDEGLRKILRESRTIAVLGIKPEQRRLKAAFTVPRYLQQVGYEIIPVPVYYPDLREILGRKVFRRVSEIPGPIDLVDVFRLSRDIPPHVPDLLEKRPKAVWFQLGIRNDEAARDLAEAGILVVQDRCTALEHRRLIR